MSNVFREINGHSIRWSDKTGVVHVVEGAEMHPGVRLLWTLCRRDVPANKAWHPKAGDNYELCMTCNAALTAGDRQ